MAKLKTDPITDVDLVDYLNTTSDFGFEIKVVKVLASLGFKLQHGGTYVDPVTDKPRQFDIRAVLGSNKRIIRLAVECKNLKPHFPLLVSCIPRSKSESFHDIIVSVDGERVSLLPPSEVQQGIYCKAMEPDGKTARFRGTASIYKAGMPVGKSCDQIGRDTQGNLTSSDSDVYEKWAQAVASSHGLVEVASHQARPKSAPVILSSIVPILVVPDGMLWDAHFDNDGNRTKEPTPTSRCSFFLNKSVYVKAAMSGIDYRISHLEFVTLTGLTELVQTLIANDSSDLIPTKKIAAKVKRYLETGKEKDGAI